MTLQMIRMLSTWKHSGFHVFCGRRISPNDDTAMEKLARYIILASFPQERMQYLDQEGKVVYTSKNGRTSKSFPVLEWLANLCSHFPNRGEQMVRYYGFRNTVRHYSSTGNTQFKSKPIVADKVQERGHPVGTYLSKSESTQEPDEPYFIVHAKQISSQPSQKIVMLK
jgi:hypothetical protein